MSLPMGPDPDHQLDRLIALAAEAIAGTGADSCVWVACSGGMDSLLLLHCAALLNHRNVQVVHVDHGLAADSADWAERVAAEAAALGLQCRIERVQLTPGANLEARARAARYRALAALLAPGDRVLTAHHLDDNLEQFLFRLVRGSAAHELCGMPAQRALGAGELVRPWLSVAHATLRECAGKLELDWINDPSNDSLQHDRNYLRHEILPRLAARWPQWQRGFERSREQIDQLVRAAATTGHRNPERPGGATPSALILEDLRSLPITACTDALQGWLHDQDVRLGSHRQLQEIVARIQAGSPSWAQDLTGPDGLRLRLAPYAGALYLRPRSRPPAPADALLLAREQPQTIQGVGRVLLTPVQVAPGPQVTRDGLTVRALELDPQAVAERTLTLRWGIRSGYLQPAGRGRRRDVKRLFQEYGVPPWWRGHIPFLFADDVCLAALGLWVERQAAPAVDAGSVLHLLWWPDAGF